MYAIHLTANDVDVISTVGYRYAWSDALSGLGPGWNDIEEHEAWPILFALEKDMMGNHQPFPMLDLGSPLAGKLFEFWHSIV